MKVKHEKFIKAKYLFIVIRIIWLCKSVAKSSYTNA